MVHTLLNPLLRSGMFGIAIHDTVALASSQTRSKSGGSPRLSVKAMRPGSEAVIVPSIRVPAALLKMAFLVSTSKVRKYVISFRSGQRSVTGAADAA